MNRSTTALLLLVLVAVAAGCLQPTPKPGIPPVIPPIAPKKALPSATPAELPEFAHWEGPSFSIDYPGTWEVQLEGDLVGFVSPTESANDFEENVNVFAAALPPEAADTSAVDLVTNSLESMQANIQGFKLLEADDQSSLGTEPGVKVTYAGTVKGIAVQFQQRVMVKDGTAYALTYTGTKEKYDSMEPMVEAMVKSFKITESSAPELVGKWISYGETVFYDSGEREWPDPSNTPSLELKADRSWTQGETQGAWDIQPIEEKDWLRWNTRLTGASRKLILYGGEGALADGPLEEANGRVDAVWLLYRAGPPAISRPGQVQMKFVRSAS